MSEFDKSFISNFEINDLTEEEINNLRIQRNEIDKILYMKQIKPIYKA